MKKRFFGILVVLVLLMAMSAAAEITIESGSENIAYISYRNCTVTDTLTGLPVPAGFVPDGTKTAFERDNLYYDGLKYYPWEGELCEVGQDPYEDECWPDPEQIVGHQEAFVCNQLYNGKQVVWIHEEPDFDALGYEIRLKLSTQTWSNFDWDYDGNYDYTVPNPIVGDPWAVAKLYSPEWNNGLSPIGKHDPNWNNDTNLSVGREYAVLVPTGYTSMLENAQAMFSSSDYGDTLGTSVKGSKEGEWTWIDAPEFTTVGIAAVLVIFGLYVYKRKKK